MEGCKTCNDKYGNCLHLGSSAINPLNSFHTPWSVIDVDKRESLDNQWIMYRNDRGVYVGLILT